MIVAGDRQVIWTPARPSHYHLEAWRSLKIVDAGQRVHADRSASARAGGAAGARCGWSSGIGRCGRCWTALRAITEKRGTTVAREVLLCTRVGHHVPP